MQQKLIEKEVEFGIENLNFDLDSYTKNSYLTHNFHPYPAKFIPQIPRELILKLSNKNEWVLDPFCGSGTTLVEAKLNQRNSIGVDINPISCLISRVKTTKSSKEQIENIKRINTLIKNDIYSGIKYDVPEYYNIDHWFKEDVKKHLSVIKHHIQKTEDNSVKDFLSTVFSSIIVKVSNQESDTRYAAIDKNLKDKIIWELFRDKTESMLKRIIEFNDEASNCTCLVYNSDSRDLHFINKKIDLIVTSPPYPNSYDYYLYHKHRMLWLGLDYKNTQEKEFGSRHKHSDKGKGIEHYMESMGESIQEVSRILKRGGYYSVVIGDAILKGKIIKMNQVLDNLFENLGYTKLKEVKFNQREYTKTFTPNIKTTHKESYILVYQY